MPDSAVRASVVGRRATVRGIVFSLVLAAIKIVAGVVGNSYALIADGIESMMDVASALIVWSSLRIAVKPPDQDHPFGHGKAESFAGLIVALLLIGAAIVIAIQSVHEILTPHHMPEVFTLFVLLGVIGSKEVMFRYLRRVASTTGSTAIETDAWQHRADALTSLAAFVGISVALWLGPGYEAADDWAALAACSIIFLNGGRLLARAINELMDAAAPEEVIRWVRTQAEATDGVELVETCRVRKMGLGYAVDMHIEVDGALSVRAGHRIAHDVKRALAGHRPPIVDVSMHVEPHPPDSALLAGAERSGEGGEVERVGGGADPAGGQSP